MEHKFYDENVKGGVLDCHLGLYFNLLCEVKSESGPQEYLLTKPDVIAMAKLMGVTKEDL